MKKVKFGNNEIFNYNGKIKKTRLYPMKRSNKKENIKTIPGRAIRKIKYYFSKKFIRKSKYYYYYKKLEYKCKLMFSKIFDDDPITNKLIQDIIDICDNAILIYNDI